MVQFIKKIIRILIELHEEWIVTDLDVDILRGLITLILGCVLILIGVLVPFAFKFHFITWPFLLLTILGIPYILLGDLAFVFGLADTFFVFCQKVRQWVFKNS